MKNKHQVRAVQTTMASTTKNLSILLQTFEEMLAFLLKVPMLTDVTQLKH